MLARGHEAREQGPSKPCPNLSFLCPSSTSLISNTPALRLSRTGGHWGRARLSLCCSRSVAVLSL